MPSSVRPRIATHRARAMALGIGLSTGLSPVLAAATPLPVVAALAGPSAAEMEEVRKLYEEGRAKYETLDYNGAIDLWTKAYAKVDTASEDNREIRNNLVYNIASAQEKAFDLDGDVTHLRAAKGLLDNYVREYKAIYKPTEAARKEVVKVEERIAELDAKLQQAEASAAPAATQPAPAAAAPPPDPRRDAKMKARRQKEALREALRSDPEIAPQYSSGKAMLGGGAAMIAIGGLTAIIAGSVAAPRSILGETAAESRRRRIGGFTAMGVGIGLIGGGTALLVIGIKRKNEAKAKAIEKANAVSVLPQLGPDGAGLSLVGRF